MIKKIKINQRNAKDIEGFEDFFDVSANGPYYKAKNNRRTRDDSYDTYNFLDTERVRLEKLDELYSDKIELMDKYPQAEKLIFKVTERLINVREKLVDYLVDFNSPINAELENIYNITYSVKNISSHKS